jgi:hypothetical protein
MSAKSRPYQIAVGRDGLRGEFDETFFSNEIVKTDGTTQVDLNIASFVQELRTALYFFATTDLNKH